MDNVPVLGINAIQLCSWNLLIHYINFSAKVI